MYETGQSNMGNAIRAIKHEVRALMPVVAFFFVAFNLIVLTDMLITEQYGIHTFSFVAATVAALVVGKIALIVDLLPFKRAFLDRPLIYTTLWTTSLYVALSFVVRYVDFLIHTLVRTGDLAYAAHYALVQFTTSRFWAVQVWLIVLFFIFAGFRELALYLGEGKLRQVFFGR